MRQIQLWDKLDRTIWGSLATKLLAFITWIVIILVMVISGTVSLYTALYGYQLYYKETFNRSIMVSSNPTTIFDCLQSVSSLIENIVPFESWYLFANAEIPCGESSQKSNLDELCLLGVNDKSVVAITNGNTLNFDKKDEILIPPYFVSEEGKRFDTHDLLGKQITICGEDYQPKISLTVVGIYDKSEMCSATMGPNAVFASFDTVELCSKTLYPDGRTAIYEEGALVDQLGKSISIIIVKEPKYKVEILSLLSKEGLDASSVMEIYPFEIGFILVLCLIFYMTSFVALYLFHRNTIKKLIDKQSSSIVLLYLLGEDYTSITKIYSIHYLSLFLMSFAFSLIISRPLLELLGGKLFQNLFVINVCNPLVLLQFSTLVFAALFTIQRSLRPSIEQELFDNEDSENE